jgi:hypothetical protein
MTINQSSQSIVLPKEGGSANVMLVLGGSLKVTLKQVPEQGGK